MEIIKIENYKTKIKQQKYGLPTDTIQSDLFNRLTESLKGLQDLYDTNLLGKEEFYFRKSQALDLFIGSKSNVEYNGNWNEQDVNNNNNNNINIDSNLIIEQFPSSFKYQKLIEYQDEKNNTKYIIQKKSTIKFDVLIPFASKEVKKVIESLKRWSWETKLPCDRHSIDDHFPGAQVNLVFYQNFKVNPDVEEAILQEVNNASWRICFSGGVKFIYAENSKVEDKYPFGVSNMFYKYFTIGSETDYFFWMENDVNPIRPNWLIELYRITTAQLEARQNKPFFLMGSNARYEISKKKEGRDRLLSNVIHVNGNAIYWKNPILYDNFLSKVEKWEKATGGFDVDIASYFQDEDNWNLVRDKYQEMIFYEFIQNYAHDDYLGIDVAQLNPRTYFIHS